MDYFAFLKTWKPFVEYKLKLRLINVAGGVPKHPDILKGWINATNKETSDEERTKLIDATKEELPDLSEEKEAKSWVGFKQDEKGIYLEGRCIKAMLKESGNCIKKNAPTTKSKKAPKGMGITALKSKVGDHVFVVENKVYIERDGKVLQEPDELVERPVHVITPQGPRSSIKRTDVCSNVEIEFTVKRFDDVAVPEKALYALVAFGQDLGVGADRSQGFGKYEVLSFDKTAESGLGEE